MEETFHKKKTEYRKSKTPHASHHTVEGAECPVQFRVHGAKSPSVDDRSNDCCACVVDQHREDREEFERAIDVFNSRNRRFGGDQK